MRTTITLDHDVHAALNEAAHRSGRSFKSTVNDVLRAGLSRQPHSSTRRAPPEFPTYAMGEPLVDLTKALALAAELEDQDFIAKFGRGA